MGELHLLEGKFYQKEVEEKFTSLSYKNEAFYLFNIDEIYAKYRLWNELMPQIRPFYAVKCNPNMTVLRVLAAMGTGFECFTEDEMSKVISIGVDPKNIIFANPTKLSSHIEYAFNNNVTILSFDNEAELYKIQALFPTAKLLIRILSDDEQALIPLGRKYGVDPNKEVPALLELAYALNLNVIGVCFHVGCGCQNPEAFRKAISAAKDVFEHGAKLGFKFELLDIGGGYGRDVELFTQIAKVINDSVSVYFPDSTVRVVAEPGRYFVETPFTLLCNVHSKRRVAGKDQIMYYIDEGVYGSFSCVYFEKSCIIPRPLRNCLNKETFYTTIWGPTGDSLDLVHDGIYLPELEIGDWLVFENMGAYTMSIITRFNGFPVPSIKTVVSKGIWQILEKSVIFKNCNYQKLELLNGSKSEEL